MARKRKKIEEELAPDKGFTVLFTALGIILLAFFILLNSIAVIDESRKRVAIGSLLGSFGLLPGGMQFEKSSKLLPPSAPVLHSDETTIEATFQSFKRLGFKVRANNRETTNENLTNLVGREELSFSIGSKALFAPGSATLKQGAEPYLKAMFDLARKTRNSIVVNGHTDNAPLQGGRYPSNWELSGARAIQVVTYLEKRGISARRLKAAGYAAERPIDTNATEEGRARNRRVEISLLGSLRKHKTKERSFDYQGFKFSTDL